MPELPKHIRRAPHVEAHIHKALMKERDAHALDRKGVVGMSQIGKCERDTWFEYNDIQEDFEAGRLDDFGREYKEENAGRVLTLFKLGHDIETHVVNLLRMAGYIVTNRDPETGAQFGFLVYDGRVGGSIDGKVMPPNKNKEYLLEVKSASFASFEKLEQAQSYDTWNPAYGDQIQGYMGFMKLDEALVVVYNKNTSAIYAEYIRFDAERFRELEARAERIISTQEAPPKPPEATSQSCNFCKYCDRAVWCWRAGADEQFDD